MSKSCKQRVPGQCQETAQAKCVNEGFAFHYKLPRKDLALRGVAIVNGVPELRFGASFNVPTLTESDVAAAMRLSLENTRPEFYYMAIPFPHPFFGRQYEHYSPTWLRNTSLGDLLSKADWTMKCLHIGARSNDSKTRFWAWQNADSQLEGLATKLDFPKDERPSGMSIIMSCKSVKVQETHDELIFPEEPQMRIDDQTNSVYSKYITAKYDSVAFHDEPLLLKMREVPKLILAAEWLKKKGVKMNEKWIAEQTSPGGKQLMKKPRASDVIDDLEILDCIRAQLPPKEFLAPLPIEQQVEMKANSEIVVTTSAQGPCGLFTLSRSLRPNDPIGMSGRKLVVPEARSWAELFDQTVPWPVVWQVPYIGIGEPMASGGVTTASIPVTKVPTPVCEPATVYEREKVHEQARVREPVCEQKQVRERARKHRERQKFRKRVRAHESAHEQAKVPEQVAVHPSVAVPECKEACQYRAYESRIGIKATNCTREEPLLDDAPSEFIPPVGTVNSPSRDVRVETLEAQRNHRALAVGVRRCFGTSDFQEHQVYDETGSKMDQPTSASESQPQLHNQPQTEDSPPHSLPAAFPARVTDDVPSTPCPSVDSGIDTLSPLPSNETTPSPSICGDQQSPNTPGGDAEGMDSGVSSPESGSDYGDMDAN